MYSIDGFEVIHEFISENDLHCVRASFEDLNIVGAGTRNGLSHPIIAKMGASCQEKLCDSGFIKKNSSIISCIIFDKNTDKNWQVPYHRDEFFCFDSQISSDSYTDWCVKEGKIYAKPCNLILSQIVSLRIAIDDNDEFNGPLSIFPRSHLLSVESDGLYKCGIDIILNSGDALLFSPLCLHASSKIKSNKQRRVLHYSWGPSVLPDGAKWSLG